MLPSRLFREWLLNHPQLPLDIDEATQDLDVLWKATEQNRSVPAYPPTTMSTLIHLLRLKRIESEIQHKIYRVDKVKSSQEIHVETNSFLERLHTWKSAIPQHQANQAMAENQVYLGYDSYVRARPGFQMVGILARLRQETNTNKDHTQMAAYYKTLRVLLQPRVYEKNIQDQYFALCVEACKGVCETYKRLHTTVPVSFNSLSLQSVFLAGTF